MTEYWQFEHDASAITVHADPAGDTYRTVRRETKVAQALTVPGLVVDFTALFADPPASRTGAGGHGSVG